jgi:PAS domain S-box-containing protein
MANNKPNERPEQQDRERLTAGRLARNLWWMAVLVAVSGVVVTVGVCLYLRDRERRVIEARFRLEAEERVGAIRREFTANLGSLHALMAFYHGSEEVTWIEFDVFTDFLFERHSGVHSYGWVPLIAADDRADHEKAAREEGYDDYKISERDPQGELIPAGEREQCYPVHFLEPWSENLLALGLDLGADDRFIGLIKKSRDTGQFAACVPPNVEQTGEETPGLLVFAPVYARNHPTDTIEQRQQAFMGVYVSVLNVSEIMEGALRYFVRAGIDIYVFDPSLPAADQLVHAAACPNRRKPLTPLRSPPETTAAVEYSGDLEVADRRWAAYCVPTDMYLSRSRVWGPATAFGVGLLITGLVTGYLVLLGRQAARTESLVTRRTEELRGSERRFRRAILEAPFPIMLHAEKGEVLALSSAWTELTGYPRDQPSTVADWQRRIGKDSPEWPGDDISGLFRAEKRKDEGEHTITTSSNERRTWHFSSAPLGRLPDGRRLAITMAMDVTDRGEAAKRLREAHEALETRVKERTAELKAINEVFQQALTCETSAEVAKRALAVAEKLTGSAFGFIGEVNEAGRFDTVALSDPGWKACRMPESDGVRMITGMEIRGIWGEGLRTERSVIVNDPASHPQRVGTPEGHPPLTSFLGVPLKHGGKTIGMIGLANKPSGYSAADQDALETLSVPFVEALMRKRAEEAVREAHDDLESRVRQRTAELARSNAELEQFAYVASHDLQEPLRMIASYVGLLAERYQGRLDRDADEFIEYAVDGARRMHQLIEDLLAFSRVGTRGKAFEPTDCNSVVDEVVGDLRLVITEQAAVVTRDDLPVVSADRTQLAQLIQNLIGNAIKFRGEEPPRVHISAEKSGREWRFSVQDNGVGIDPKYRDRVFAIFQRLHTRKEYPGTGIGLAICRRIVERHGGRIWLESESGKGAVFRFTLLEQGGPS